MYIRNSELRFLTKKYKLETYKNPARILVRGFDFKNPIFGPTFDG